MYISCAVWTGGLRDKEIDSWMDGWMGRQAGRECRIMGERPAQLVIAVEFMYLVDGMVVSTACCGDSSSSQPASQLE